MPTAGMEQAGDIDLDESMAMMDDGYWSRIAFRLPFTWQRFIDWWAARRYVQPRDVTRR